MKKNNNVIILLVLLVILIGTTTMMAIWDSPVVFDNCDSTSGWSATYDAVLSIDTVDKFEGSGCIVATMGVQWGVTIYKSGSWDWTATPWQRFRFKPDYSLGDFTWEVVTFETEGYTYNKYPFTPSANVWNTIIVDLANPTERYRLIDGDQVPVTDPMEWDNVREVKLWWMIGTEPITDHVLKLDIIELDSTTGTTPITASITPATATVTEGQTQTFTCTATGGSGSYIYEWDVDGTPVGTLSSYTTSPSLLAGVYAIGCEVTDAVGSTPGIDSSTLFVDLIASGDDYTLIMGHSTGGTIQPSAGPHSYPSGSSVDLYAIPDQGFEFSHWEINGAFENQENVTITMDTNTVANATFVLEGTETMSDDTTSNGEDTGTSPTGPAISIDEFSVTQMVLICLAVGAIIIYLAKKPRQT